MEEPKKSKRINKGPWKHEVMASRRKIADERQAEYNKLTIAQKTKKLDDGGFTATRQRARLAKQSEKSKEKK